MESPPPYFFSFSISARFYRHAHTHHYLRTRLSLYRREAVVSSQVGPPKLVDFDWRVDLKTASNHLSRMAVPTVLVSMKVQNQPTEVGVMPSVKDVQFEMGASALNTLLDGLGKIRDQLGSIQ